jgi:hypothetical protein
MTDYDYDPEDAHVQINNARAITNRDQRRDIIAAQTALALADIAASLRVLAAAELGQIAYDEPILADDIEQPVEPVDLTDADAGTRVRLITPGTEPREGELSGSGGIDQGIPWVGVYWDDAIEAVETDEERELSEARVFVPHLEAVHAPTVEYDRAQEALKAVGPLDSGIDADFAGDPMPTKTADALDALKAAKKKGKGKK